MHCFEAHLHRAERSGATAVRAAAPSVPWSDGDLCYYLGYSVHCLLDMCVLRVNASIWTPAQTRRAHRAVPTVEESLVSLAATAKTPESRQLKLTTGLPVTVFQVKATNPLDMNHVNKDEHCWVTYMLYTVIRVSANELIISYSWKI